MTAGEALPVAQAHLSRSGAVPVADMHVGVDQSLRLAIVDSKDPQGGRPYSITLREHAGRNDMGGGTERLAGVIFQAHFFGADSKLSWIAGDPWILGRQLPITVETRVPRRQKIDYVFRHRTKNICSVVAKSCRLRCDEILQEKYRRKRSAIICGVIADRRPGRLHCG